MCEVQEKVHHHLQEEMPPQVVDVDGQLFKHILYRMLQSATVSFFVTRYVVSLFV